MTEDETGRKPEEPSSGPPDGRDGIGGFGDKPEKPVERDAEKKRTHFPLIEFVVVIAVVIFFFWACVGPGCVVKDKAKQAETKYNLHQIQIVLARYATDNDMRYPPFLFGGDYTDSFAVDEKYVSEAGLTAANWPGNKPMQLGDVTCHDVLITEGYLTEYPKNPFIVRGSVADAKAVWARKLTHFCSTSTVNPVVRYVGGARGDLMVDIAGPPPAGAVADRFHGDEFILPPYQAPPGTTWDDASNSERWVRKEDYRPYPPEPGNSRLVGNFYYYSWLNTKKAGWLLSNGDIPSGYHLVAYGALRNLGFDVYDATGEYQEQHRIMTCDLRNETKGQLPGLPCPPDGKENVYHEHSRGGPDGFKDGVILVLDSEAEIKPGSGVPDDSKASND